LELGKDETWSKCSPTGDWLNALCYLPTMENHVSVRKKNPLYVQSLRYIVHQKAKSWAGGAALVVKSTCLASVRS
jgi:hypothetical protein